MYRTGSENTQIIDRVKHRLVEILITNSNDTSILSLSLLLHSTKRGTKLGDSSGINWGSYARLEKSTFARERGLWTLRDGAVIPPGVSTLRVYLNDDQLNSRIGVGFLDQNVRKWTRWLDGELVEGWKPDDI